MPPPPQPVNIAPTVTLKTPTAQQDITVKSFSISAAFSDDVECKCVAAAELYIKGILVPGFPKLGVQTISYTWNTSPWKGKGVVSIEVRAKDAEGLETRKSVVVTVRK